ncbi:proteasome assembly chaperone family protein [Nocardioides jejuensis]|uniref:PAC2 family protein n=1 Tax=Nocardioides jejuensis TaxID=2502782 RepID=A0A4R1CHS2_9ACTN|nr:PAC2 family protein [Nocardioides jejuensis]TCJ30840.1 PAC2 family protein [Nocardioides jejuensis]
MAGSNRFVHIVDDVTDLGDDPVLVVALHGFLDAGNGSVLAVDHLESTGGVGPVVATFDVDVFHDYRARRPAISFVEDHYESYDAPRLVVRVQRDATGRAFLLLSGPEPDNRWEAFAGAVREVVEVLGVSLVVSLGSVPMAVPHTRPLAVTQHANRRELLLRANQWRGELRIPSSAHALLEVRLGESGHPMVGWVVHVPHYVQGSDYPEAARALLSGVEDSTGLTFDLDALKVAAERRTAEIAEHLAENPDVAELVAGMEQQYDAFQRGIDESLLATDQPIPTGDELGAEFEKFLAGLDGPGAGSDETPDAPEGTD